MIPARSGLLAFALGLGVGACFDAPRPAVQFSCDPVDAPQCPPDYACEADGCCHLVGSDLAAHEGECKLGGALPTGGGTGASSSGGATGDTDGSSSGSSGSTPSTGSSDEGDPSSSTSSSGGSAASSSGDSCGTAGSSSEGSGSGTSTG